MTVEFTNPDQQYQAYLAGGKFCLQRSRSTGQVFWYPRLMEPLTGATDLEWVEVSGMGTVYSTTTVREKPPKPSFNISLIELTEGPRMMSRVEGLSPDAVKIGMQVRAKIIDQDGTPIVVFEALG